MNDFDPTTDDEKCTLQQILGGVGQHTAQGKRTTYRVKACIGANWRRETKKKKKEAR